MYVYYAVGLRISPWNVSPILQIQIWSYSYVLSVASIDRVQLVKKKWGFSYIYLK